MGEAHYRQAIEPNAATLQELIDRVRDRHGDPFRPEDSPLHGRCIFIVGAPRSGTTWLHQLLAQHPAVATAGESHIFADGVSYLLENHRDPDPWMHLSTWVPASELDTAVRALCDTVFESLRRAQNPDATRVLDKSPNARPYAADLARIYPDATFLHIIRDGRDMAGSAHDLWGWSERFAAWEQAATTWIDAVTDNRTHLPPLRYREVLYEDLLGDTAAGLTAIFDFVGLDHDPAFVDAVVSFGRAPVNVRPSDTRIAAGKWQGDDRDAERRVVRVAGRLLVELGYLTEERRAEIVSGTTPAEALRTVITGARRAASGVLSTVRERRGSAERAARSHVREVGRRAAEAVVGDDRGAVVTAFGDAAVEADDGEALTVADLHLGRGTTIAAVDADEHACAVQLRTRPVVASCTGTSSTAIAIRRVVVQR